MTFKNKEKFYQVFNCLYYAVLAIMFKNDYRHAIIIKKTHAYLICLLNPPVWPYAESLHDPGWILQCRPHRCCSRRQSAVNA